MLQDAWDPSFFQILKLEAVVSEVQEPPFPPPAEAARPNLQMVAYQFSLFLYLGFT